MKKKKEHIFGWIVFLSAITIIPILIVFFPDYYEWSTIILILSWLAAYLVFFFRSKRKDLQRCGRLNPGIKCSLCGDGKVYDEGYCAGCYYAVKGIR